MCPANLPAAPIFNRSANPLERPADGRLLQATWGSTTSAVRCPQAKWATQATQATALEVRSAPVWPSWPLNWLQSLLTFRSELALFVCVCARALAQPARACATRHKHTDACVGQSNLPIEFRGNEIN